MRKLLQFAGILLILFGLVSCQQSSTTELVGTIDIIISQSFGNDSVEDVTLNYLEDYSVIDYMEENFETETAYGGGFINSIYGIQSGFTDKNHKEKLDWFYYVNGRLADIGSEDYFLLPNDVVIWDYHSWEYGSYIPNIVGAYPSNFTNSFIEEPLNLEIIEDGNYTEEVNALSEYLEKQGVKEIKINNYNENSLNQLESNSIIIGKFNQIKDLPIIEGSFKNKEQLGIFYDNTEHLKVYSYDRQKAQTYDKGAVIASIPKEYGSFSSIWMITGNDEKLIKKAVETLYKNPRQLRGKFSVLVTKNEIINLPITKN
jgi:hypothetical protein